MKTLITLATSSLGRKYLMAITGAGLFAFIIAHMLGNWLIFLGPDAINAYALKLKSMPELLWTARIGLLALAGIHVACAISLIIDNHRAKSTKYAVGKPVNTNWASRSMALSGLVVFAFIFFHIAHFTTQNVDLSYREMYASLDGKKVHDVYNMVVKGFSHPLVAGFYILAVGLLGAHLSHGVQSMFRSLGLSSPRIFPLLKKAALAFGILIGVGMAAVPLSVLSGIVKARPDIKYQDEKFVTLHPEK